MGKRLPVIIFLFTAFILFTGAGEVTIIRKLPATSENQVEAQWHSPGRNLESAAPSRPAELSGRLDFGGTGQDREDTDPAFGFYTDSHAKLLLALTDDLYIQTVVNALRKQKLDSREQQYGGNILFNHEKMQVDISGLYHDTLMPGTGGELFNQDAQFKAGLSTTFIPNVPLTLSGVFNWKNSKEAALITTQDSIVNANLKAGGDLGAFRFDLVSEFSRENNSLDGIENLGINGGLTLALDVLKFLTLQAEVVPTYTNTLYTESGSEFSVTDLASRFGLLFPFSEVFQSKLLVGVTGNWQDNPESETLSYQGELGFDIVNLSGFYSAPYYRISGAEEGNTLHNFSLDLSWKPENIKFVENLGAAAGWQQQLAADNSPVSDKKLWSLGFMLYPLETLSLQSSYKGSLYSASGQLYKHKVSAQYKHTPARSFNYAFSADIDITADEQDSQLDSKYSMGFALLPQWNLKVYSFNFKETFGFFDVSSGDLVLSQFNFLTAIPLFDFLNVRYNLEWEWTNSISPGAVTGNALRHLAGLGLNAAPLTFLCEYAYSHGFRGQRHDVLADLTLKFSKSLSLHSRFELNAYNLDTAAAIPFLIGVNLVYEF